METAGTANAFLPHVLGTLVAPQFAGWRSGTEKKQPLYFSKTNGRCFYFSW
jgi:putative SOS response-associated peptidase YedK